MCVKIRSPACPHRLQAAAAIIALLLAWPSIAAGPPPSGGAGTVVGTTAVKPAAECLNDLRDFDRRMERDGYLLSGAGYQITDSSKGQAGGRTMRHGHEIRTLIESANILARQGQGLPCESVLVAARSVYKLYRADVKSADAPLVSPDDWRRQQISAARSVTSAEGGSRSDQFLDTEVRDPQGRALGSVVDLVFDADGGNLAYLVLAREGIFELHEKYIPVPWASFKITPLGTLLVLGASKADMDAAPWGNRDQFTTSAEVNPKSETVDAYWQTALSGHDKN